MFGAERKFIQGIALDGMRDIERRARPIDLSVRRVAEFFETMRCCSVTIAQDFAIGVIRLKLQPLSEAAQQIDLKRVVRSMAVIGQQEAGERDGVPVKLDGPRKTCHVILLCQFARLAG